MAKTYTSELSFETVQQLAVTTDQKLFIGLVSIFVIFIIAGLMKRKKESLVFNLKLKSRKDFDTFNADDYLADIDELRFKAIQGLLDEDNNKKRLTLKWQYVTPSGKQEHYGSKTYNMRFIREYVDKMAPMFDTGKTRIWALNKQYGEKLVMNKEINDGLPKIYCYTILGDHHEGLVKVGYAKTNARKRIKEQLKTAAHMKIDYKILFIMPALNVTGEHFKDHSVHKLMKNAGIDNPMGEWFDCSAETARKAVESVQMNAKKIMF